MESDLELLEAYAREKSEESFTALVNRHLNLVYSAALRQVRSPQLAHEVAQTVFTDLSRAAVKLKPDTILTAWLYQVTRRTAIDAVRREARRLLCEQIATEMNTLQTDTRSPQNGTPADDWSHIELIPAKTVPNVQMDGDCIMLRGVGTRLGSAFTSVGRSGAPPTRGVENLGIPGEVSSAHVRIRSFHPAFALRYPLWPQSQPSSAGRRASQVFRRG